MSRVIHMHVKDQVGGRGVEKFPPLGEGEVNLARVFEIVRRSRFVGPFCLEIEFATAYLRKRDEERKSGFEFIKNQLN